MNSRSHIRNAGPFLRHTSCPSFAIHLRQLDETQPKLNNAGFTYLWYTWLQPRCLSLIDIAGIGGGRIRFQNVCFCFSCNLSPPVPSDYLDMPLEEVVLNVVFKAVLEAIPVSRKQSILHSRFTESLARFMSQKHPSEELREDAAKCPDVHFTRNDVTNVMFGWAILRWASVGRTAAFSCPGWLRLFHCIWSEES